MNQAYNIIHWYFISGELELIPANFVSEVGVHSGQVTDKLTYRGKQPFIITLTIMANLVSQTNVTMFLVMLNVLPVSA